MRIFKFRGYYKAIKSFVYGDLTHTDSDEVRVNGYLVEPDSVAQFIGCDKDGEEIYEGDKMVDSQGHVVTVQLNPIGIEDKGNLRFDWNPQDCKFQASRME